jgi:hypothetical protein
MQVSRQKCQSDRSGMIFVGGAQIARNSYLKKYDLLIFEKRVDWSASYKEKLLVVGMRTLHYSLSHS